MKRDKTRRRFSAPDGRQSVGWLVGWLVGAPAKIHESGERRRYQPPHEVDELHRKEELTCAAASACRTARVRAWLVPTMQTWETTRLLSFVPLAGRQCANDAIRGSQQAPKSVPHDPKSVLTRARPRDGVPVGTPVLIVITCSLFSRFWHLRSKRS
jgi:hypothetical protein